MGGGPTTLWVYLVPFGRYTWERACIALAERYVTHATHAAKKNLRKIEYSRRGAWPTAVKFLGSMQHLWPLISHPGLFGVRIQRTELFRQNGAEITPTSRSK